MFDALEAHLESDHKKSILYSAIAVESFASNELDRKYQSKIDQELPELNMRMIELRISSKTKVRKDPVYEFIRDHRRFKNVLHEQSFYVMGKSLLVAQKNLYDRAVKLYETRNHIAHTGTSPLDKQFFRISMHESTEALKTATAVLKWFGDDGKYVVPTGLAFLKDGRVVTPSKRRK